MCVSFLSAEAQEEKRQIRFSLEAGIGGFGTSLADNKYIRKEPVVYTFNGIEEATKSYLVSRQLGIALEMRSRDDKFGFLTGLRYNHMLASIESEDNFFYVLYDQQGTTTEYMRMKALHERSGYIGIPLEIRHFVYKRRTFRFYLKVGSDINCLIYTRKDATFHNEAMMRSYKDNVVSLIEKTDPFYATFYLAYGIKIGSKTEVSFEIPSPTVFLSGRPSGLVNPKVGYGIKASVQLPF